MRRVRESTRSVHWGIIVLLALLCGCEAGVSTFVEKGTGQDLLAAPPQLAPWEPVSGHDTPYTLCKTGAVVFNDSIYLIAGDRNNGGISDEVWRSSDGFHWEMILENAPFPRRNSPAVTVHNGKIWLSGGLQGDVTAVHELWDSSDGQIWHRFPFPDAPFTSYERFGHGIASVGGNLVIFGGMSYNMTTGPSYPSDPHILGPAGEWHTVAAPFQLADFGYAMLNGRLYVAGGWKDAQYTPSNEVWSTNDGFEWRREPEGPFAPRIAPHLVALGESLFLLGGYIRKESEEQPGSTTTETLTDVWVTADASEWGRVREMTPCLERSSFIALPWKDALFVFGGYPPHDVYSGPILDICSSPDGYHWETTSFPVTLPLRWGHQTVVFNNALWVTGGRSSNGGGVFYEDLWRSFDGVTWEEMPSPAQEEGNPYGTYPSLGVFDNSLWMIEGTYQKRSLWRSDDGEQWTRIAEHLSFASAEDTVLLSFQGKLLIMGGDNADITSFTEVWASSDGITWECLTTTAPSSDPRKTVVHNDAIFIFSGGVDFGVIFRSTDAVTWKALVGFPRYDARANLAAASYRGRLWIVGGKDAVPKNDVWSSVDGTSWARHPDAPFAPRLLHTLTAFDDRLWVIGGAFWYGKDTYTLPDIWVTEVVE